MKIYKFPDFGEKNLKEYNSNEIVITSIGLLKNNKTYTIKIGSSLALIFNSLKDLKKFRDIIDSTIIGEEK